MRVGWGCSAQHIAAQLGRVGNRLTVIDDRFTVGATKGQQFGGPHANVGGAQRVEEPVTDIDIALRFPRSTKRRHALEREHWLRLRPRQNDADLAVPEQAKAVDVLTPDRCRDGCLDFLKIDHRLGKFAHGPRVVVRAISSGEAR